MKIDYKDKIFCFPDFLIVGAMKSGTTALYNWLKMHPQIYLPEETKEPRFFICYTHPHYYERWPYMYELRCDIENYSRLFYKAKKGQKIGEASVAYLHSFDIAIANIKKIYGSKSQNLKIIIILRNPIERTFSHYMAAVRAGGEKLALKEALEIEMREFKSEKDFRIAIDKMLAKRIKMTSEDFYFWTSKYYLQVKAYIENFPYVKVYLYEDLKEEPLKFVKNIFEFLEVDSDFIPSNIGISYNVSLIPKSIYHKIFYDIIVKYNPLKFLVLKIISEQTKGIIIYMLRQIFHTKPQMPPETREMLKEIFKEDILKLQELIGRDLSHWLK